MTQLDKALRGTVIALLFATVVIPFIKIDSMLFPFITGKGFAFRLIVEAAFALWAVLAIRVPEYRPRWKSPVLVTGAAFLLVVALADFFAVDQIVALWSKFERMDGLVLMLHLGAYALVLSSVFKTAADWRRFLTAHVIAAIAMSVYAATQILGLQTINQGGIRADGTLGNAVYLAGYMLFSIGFALYLALRAEDKTFRALCLVASAAFLVVLVFTGTRGSVLGLVAGLGLAGAVFLTFGRGNPYRKAGAWIVGAIALAIALFAVGRELDVVRAHPVFGRYVKASLEDKTVVSRIVNAEIAWQGFLERPVLGWGQGNYGIVFDSHYDQRLHDQEQYFDRTHSILTDWLVAGGALGFLGYFALLAVIAYGLWRAEPLRRDERTVLIALLAAYLVHNVFVFDNLVSYMHYAALAALAIALGPGKESRRVALGADAKALLAAAVVVALPVVAYLVNAAPIRAATSVIDGMTLFATTPDGQQVLANPNGLAGNRAAFESAVSGGSFGAAEAAVQYTQIAASVAAAEQVPEADRAAFVNGADAAMQAAIAAHPDDSYYRYALGVFRLRIGDFPRAVEALEAAVERAPQKQSVRAPLALAYAWANDPRALDYAHETYEIEPANDPAWRAYARVAAKLGRDDIFRELVAAAQAAGQHDRVIALVAEQVSANPGNPQARASLARALVDAGRYDEAIQVLDEAIAQIPAGKAQFEAFRAQIVAEASSTSTATP
jgi:O-antigen ligase/thioredoxin-like negative regulator of GroEL